MSDVITGNTQLAATKNDLIISLVQRELKASSKLLPFCTDFSAFAGKGSKSISVPKLTSFTVENRSSATAGTIQGLTTTVDTIDLNINAYVSWLIDSMDLQQTSIDAQIEFAKRAATAHGRYVDAQILSVLDADGQDDGDTNVTAAKLLTMRKNLLEANANMDELVLVVPPAQESVMLGLTEFSEAQVYGNAVIPSGVIGRVYGVPVLVHNLLDDDKCYMFAKSGVGYAFQQQPKMASQAAIEYGTSAMKVAMDQVWGVASLQQGEAGASSGTSPLIRYLNPAAGP